MIKAVIFDLDGTLLDTSRDIQAVLNSSLKKFGLSALSLEQVKEFVGDGETDVLTAANARIKCVSALWGFRTQEQLKKAGASLFAKNYEELKNIVFSV